MKQCGEMTCEKRGRRSSQSKQSTRLDCRCQRLLDYLRLRVTRTKLRRKGTSSTSVYSRQTAITRASTEVGSKGSEIVIWAREADVRVSLSHCALLFDVGPLFLLPGIVIAMYVTKTAIPEEWKIEISRYLSNIQRQRGLGDDGWGM